MSGRTKQIRHQHQASQYPAVEVSTVGLLIHIRGPGTTGPPDRPSQLQQSGQNQGQQPSGCYNGMWKKELDVNVVLSCRSRKGAKEAA